MKSNAILVIMLFLTSCIGRQSPDEAALQKLYSELDTEIARTENYEDAKEKRIAGLRGDLASPSADRLETINALIKEYEAYDADSALYYIGCGLKEARASGDGAEETMLNIRRADILAHAGLFSDALSAIEQIHPDSLKGIGKEKYYSAYCDIYQYLSEYTNEHEPAAENERMRGLYVDSLRMVVSPQSFDYMVNVLTERARAGKDEEALAVLEKKLNDYSSGQRCYSILASILASVYKARGNENEYKRYLTLSAISDVRGAVKENMSFRELATVMFEDGDVHRANAYLKKSISDANFYSAMMRNAQSSQLLPVIDDAYATAQQRLTRRLRILMVISSVLSIVLMLTVFFILKQMRSLHRANERVHRSNEELSVMSDLLKKANEELTATNSALQTSNSELTTLSDELKDANGQLAERNTELGEYNKIKEQYAALFMEYCSSAISSLHRYQQTLRKLTLQGGNREALLKKLESSETADRMLSDFYQKFDEAILKIYPDFVEKFNRLLNPDARIVLKSGELLNTELRLFALIRIGIDDSNKIADFLRCSLSTVYTYRSKMRKRAIAPDDFEQNVRNIH